MSPLDESPGISGDADSKGSSGKDNAAAFAAAFLDLWQRNIAAIAADPRSGPTLSMIEQNASAWLRNAKPPV